MSKMSLTTNQENKVLIVKKLLPPTYMHNVMGLDLINNETGLARQTGETVRLVKLSD